MPSISNIQLAVYNLDKCLRVSKLKGSSVKEGSDGLPDAASGGFCSVFQLEKQSMKWAFRVWHKELKNLKDRFQKISEYLSNQKLAYFADFIYDDNGLLVNGELVDTIHMDWIDGLSLKEYISKNINNNVNLKKLAETFFAMCKDLHKHKISHGDLQHNNILIDKDDKIKLIDYDSVCVPDIEGEKELVAGLPAYQHPSRITGDDSNKTSLKADYFSELIIYLSIIAITEKTSLWNTYNVENTDVLLFKDDDFLDIKKSKIYTELSKGFSDDVKNLLKILADYLDKKSYLDLEPFSLLITSSNNGGYGKSNSAFCTYCGDPIHDSSAIFCPKTGKRL